MCYFFVFSFRNDNNEDTVVTDTVAAKYSINTFYRFKFQKIVTQSICYEVIFISNRYSVSTYVTKKRKFFALSLNKSKQEINENKCKTKKEHLKPYFSVYFLENGITVLLKFLDIFF